jgi:hypothetical protein
LHQFFPPNVPVKESCVLSRTSYGQANAKSKDIAGTMHGLDGHRDKEATITAASFGCTSPDR